MVDVTLENLLLPAMLLLILFTTTKLQVETILHLLSQVVHHTQLLVVRKWLALEGKEVNTIVNPLVITLLNAQDQLLIVQKEDVKITFADL